MLIILVLMLQIRAQNDLIVNGNLYLGGYTGSSSSIQGYIVNNYVSLDLNGHQLIINNGGMVHSFGYIYDSMGTGDKIQFIL